MERIKMGMSKHGLALIEKGISPTLWNYDEELKHKGEIAVLVYKEHLVSNNDGTYELNKLNIHIVD